MRQRNIGIINYGVGNHSSVVHAIKSLGYRATLSNDINELKNFDTLLLPGVGSFSVAMQGLERFGLTGFLQNWAYKKKQLIGICLGMQVLATSGTEGGFRKGLDLLPGEVVKITDNSVHIGWNSIQFLNHENILNSYEGVDFYFNHSYKFQTKTNSVSATVNFGEDIPAIVFNGSVVGLQFHPEKSQENGLNLLCKLIEGA